TACPPAVPAEAPKIRRSGRNVKFFSILPIKLMTVCPGQLFRLGMRAPMQDRTFLFTDIEGSTKLWEQSPERMRDALARHDSILRKVIEGQGGTVFKTVGDSFCATFPTVSDAVGAAAMAQHEIIAERWEEIGEPIHVRMAIHSGPAEARDGDYFGTTMNRVARILSSAHGGQILLSKAAVDLLGAGLPPKSRLSDLGEHRLKDLIRP